MTVDVSALAWFIVYFIFGMVGALMGFRLAEATLSGLKGFPL